ncbi:hypothetical protein OsJ_27004 [Oryza sativa Japonica Group]|uniref:Glucose-methanol-choline oxidoreductase C-terminal domain-containing protein n=2 Tax=Oryza sativa subsp. japonica TaxID=39947 RepID=A3BS90_ORYSJ|nr:hypothetical protein OsJ_27004 [Oryza sativa Japonica Group]
MGCCRMGTTVGNGTIDAHGESWEAEQLYVCNDSVLPTAVGINPMITVQSVAYCVANGIADSLSGSSKSTTGRVPAQQSSDYKSKTADQYYYNSISSSKSQQLGGAGAKSSKGTIKRYPTLNG